MAFMIPSSRVIVWREGMTGGDHIPEEARPVPLAGGASELTTGKDKLYLVVNTLGEPAVTKSGKQKIYEASSPSNAATKAFYAWWRSTQKASTKVTDPSFRKGERGNDYKLLQDHLDRMQDKMPREKLRDFEEARQRYEDSWLRIDRPALESRRLLVRLAALGGKTAATTRNYMVSYQPNLNPNVMEIMGPGKRDYKPIVVNAKATHLARDSPIGGGGINYLERELQFMS